MCWWMCLTWVFVWRIAHWNGSGRTNLTAHNRFVLLSKHQSVIPTIQCCSGSVIGPQKFTANPMHIQDIVDTAVTFSVNHHLYTDDAQLQKNERTDDIQNIILIWNDASRVDDFQTGNDDPNLGVLRGPRTEQAYERSHRQGCVDMLLPFRSSTSTPIRIKDRQHSYYRG